MSGSFFQNIRRSWLFVRTAYLGWSSSTWTFGRPTVMNPNRLNWIYLRNCPCKSTMFDSYNTIIDYLIGAFGIDYLFRNLMIIDSLGPYQLTANHLLMWCYCYSEWLHVQTNQNRQNCATNAVLYPFQCFANDRR